MLEPRLHPLLETLTRAGLDWLVEEVVAGAPAGSLPPEKPEAVLAARAIVFRARQDAGFAAPAAVAPGRAEAPTGPQQLRWAARHVGERLAQVLEMSRQSLDRLDALVEKDRDKDEAGTNDEEVDARATLVLVDGDEAARATRAQLDGAAKGLDALRVALASWVAETLDGE